MGTITAIHSNCLACLSKTLNPVTHTIVILLMYDNGELEDAATDLCPEHWQQLERCRAIEKEGA